MAARTTPVAGTVQQPTTLRGYHSPFVNYPYIAESLKAKLQRLEADYKTNPTVSRSAFVQSQMMLIRDTYTYFNDALSDLSTQNLNVPVETLLAQVTTTVGEYVSEPFGTILKGFALAFTMISKQNQQDQLVRIQRDADYYYSQISQLQAMYDAYQAELTRSGYLKVALIGIPALLLYLKHRRDGN